MILSDKCAIKAICDQYIENTCPGQDHTAFCQKLFRIDYLMSQALLTEKQKLPIKLYKQKDDSDYDAYIELKKIYDNIDSFVDNGKNLYIHSKISGNGKTSWAIKLLQAYLIKTYKRTVECRALFINVPSYLIALKDSISNKNEYAQHIKENILTADLVVWDEIATKTATTYELENLLSIINTRIDNGKSNIYTSNMDPIDLNAKLGDRLYSRIVNLSKEIVFYDGDKRGDV